MCGYSSRFDHMDAPRTPLGALAASSTRLNTADLASQTPTPRTPSSNVRVREWRARNPQRAAEQNQRADANRSGTQRRREQRAANHAKYTEEVCYTLPPNLDEHAARDEASGWLLLGNERRMRRTDLEEPVDRTFLGGLRRTSPADLAADEAWRFAPVGVLSHVERDTINHAQLERFARAFGLPLVKMARAVLKRVIGFINLAAKAVPWGNRERAAET